jgi:hypothetical protein
MSNETKLGKEFYATLQERAQDAVKETFKSKLYPVQYPSQGDIMWFYSNINQFFNGSTFDYISANVSPGDIDGTVKMSAASGFPNDYDQVATALSYKLSQKNQHIVDTAQKNAATQQFTVISDYQAIFGTITPAQMAEASVANKIDYVISYKCGSVWSGKTPPLTYREMADARNLRDLLPKAPASADKVITEVSNYLRIMESVIGLLDKVQNGQWIIRTMKRNTKAPTDENGGIKTFDPNTGAVSTDFRVGYSINSSIASITNDLKNQGRTISLDMTTSAASGGSVNVSVAGQAGFSIGSWLSFSTQASGSYDMSQAAGTSTTAEVKMTWAGFSMVPMAPKAWAQDSKVGWFYAGPIQQAIDNIGEDVDGFYFLGDQPPYNMGDVEKGGNFGFFTNLLIANFPTVKITYSKADFKTFKENWKENVSGNLKLFGAISLGSFSQGAYGSSYEEGSDNSTFTVTFSASPAVISVPQAQQTAYVIAGAIENPGKRLKPQQS